MQTDVLTVRIKQIDEQLTRINEKRKQHDELLAQLPKDDPSYPKHEADKYNGLVEMVELLNERTKLTYIADHAEVSRLKVEVLRPLISEDLKESARKIVADFEGRYGKATAAGCKVCVDCVKCSAQCPVGACFTCVHCPPNGVLKNG